MTRLTTNRRCEHCGEELISTVEHNYRDDLLGIIQVVLIDAVEKLSCVKHPEVSFTLIPDLDGLIAAAAVARVMVPVKLSGKDIRFLRKAVRYTGKQFANCLSVSEEAISRWENDKQPVGPASEKLLRLLVGLKLKDQAPGVDFDQEQVASMMIPSVRSQPEQVVMAFQRMPMKINMKREQAWMPEERVAA